MAPRRALISGAGIAGPAAAFWLRRYGWTVTVVERAPALRTAGQNVDVRGAAREVLRRMDLDEAVGARTTGEVGTRFVDGDGRSVGEFPASESDDGNGATAEREILRGQLAELFFERTHAEVDYRFGTTVADLDRSGDDPVRVTLSDGTTDAYDVVILAEGIGSATRERLGPAFGTVERRALGVSVAYFSIDRVATDDPWWRWYVADGGRSITLRPDNVGRQRVTLSFRSDPVNAGRPQDEIKALLRTRFANAGWEAPRILDQLDDVDDLYLDDLGQIRADRWSAGRVVLLGDAASCPSPVSGMGTSLSLVGAYVLAGELAAHVDHRDAFGGYERVMRPYVDRAQQLPPGAPGVMHPRTRLGAAALRTGFRLASSGPLRAFERLLFHPPADGLELPDYAHLDVQHQEDGRR